MPTTTVKNIAFIIRLKSPQRSNDWDHTVALALRCLSSVFNQTMKNFTIYLSCNSFPYVSTSPQLKILEDEYALPSDWNSAHSDKYRKVQRALVEAGSMAP
jgi:hypothetical protein